jgi:Ca2+-binding RTX toxin-like protein
MDLAAINIQRGHDMGLGTLNQTREALGLDPYTDFSEITSDPATAAALKTAFGTVDQVDLWTGGLSENHAPGAMVGATFQKIIATQFEVLRDGDRLWFENQGFDAHTLDRIENSTLADIIVRNTDVQDLQDDVFVFAVRHTGAAGGSPSEVSEHLAEPQLVLGSNGVDTLTGGLQSDTLVAGTGTQTMTGLDGADVFRFHVGPTSATITDFQPGVDKLEFDDGGKLSFSDAHITEHHGNTVVEIGDDHIELLGVRPFQLSNHDFIV